MNKDPMVRKPPAEGIAAEKPLSHAAAPPANVLRDGKQCKEHGDPSPPIPVSIYLRGIQTIDGEDYITDLFTCGTFYQRNGKYYLVYREKGEDAEEDTTTTLKIEGQHKIFLTRRGATRSNLVIERGVRHVGFYSTMQGDFTIGVSAAAIEVTLRETSATLSFKYALDINTAHVSDHKVHIELTTV